MNQEKITELEKTICRDYSNTAGIVVLKTAEQNMKTTLTAAHPTAAFMFTQSPKAFCPY